MVHAVALGALILLGSLYPAIGIVRSLPRGANRRQWILLTIMIAIFLAGYLWYWLGHIGFGGLHAILDHGETVALVFFLGAVFVFAVVSSSYRTIDAMARIPVLEAENITDPLMGIHNRRYFDTRLRSEVARARRLGTPLALLMFDVDCFKQINDRWGHKTGDAVLARIGAILREATRETDIPARIGGDEVAILVPGDSLDGAERLGNRILELIRNDELAPGVRCSVSIGIVELAPEHQSPEELVEAADRRLYQAKRAGRDRISVTESSGGRSAM